MGASLGTEADEFLAMVTAVSWRALREPVRFRDDLDVEPLPVSVTLMLRAGIDGADEGEVHESWDGTTRYDPKDAVATVVDAWRFAFECARDSNELARSDAPPRVTLESWFGPAVYVIGHALITAIGMQYRSGAPTTLSKATRRKFESMRKHAAKLRDQIAGLSAHEVEQLLEATLVPSNQRTILAAHLRSILDPPPPGTPMNAAESTWFDECLQRERRRALAIADGSDTSVADYRWIDPDVRNCVAVPAPPAVVKTSPARLRSIEDAPTTTFAFLAAQTLLDDPRVSSSLMMTQLSLLEDALGRATDTSEAPTAGDPGSHGSPRQARSAGRARKLQRDAVEKRLQDLACALLADLPAHGVIDDGPKGEWSPSERRNRLVQATMYACGMPSKRRPEMPDEQD